MSMHNNNKANSNDWFSNAKSACVVGLGETGRSCLRFLAKKNFDLVAMDSSNQLKDLDKLKTQHPQTEFVISKIDLEKLLDCDLVVLSPGVPIYTAEIAQASKAGIPVVGDIELFAHETDDAKVISITGSNGKSTVTALCGELLVAAGLKAQIGGNIGYPALDLLDKPADIYVLELSSFQLESTYSLNSSVAVILNISPDHMDRYDSIADYIDAKRRIFNQATSVLYNRADQHTYPHCHQAAKIISFGLDKPPHQQDFGLINVNGQDWLCQGEAKLVRVDSLKIKGQHNQLNALAALALAFLIGADLDRTIPALLNFKGLPHRFELVGQYDGVDWINDSKGTNPGATLASICGQSQPIILIVGGDAKDADFSILSEAVNQHVKAVVLFGRDAVLIESMLSKQMPYVFAENLDDAVVKANQFAQQNDMVLFSPACASFDMFSNYAQRGDAFKKTVKDYFEQGHTT